MLAPILLALAASFALALVLTPLAGRLARRVGALDHPGIARKCHRTAVPRIGGLAIAAAFLGGVGLAAAVGGPAIQGPRVLAIALAGVFVVAAGAIDDVRGMSPRVKLVAQVAAAALVWAGGLRVEAVANPFGAPLLLGDLSLPFTLLFLVGAMNAMNLIDGLDGLAGGVAATAAAAAVAVAVLRATGPGGGGRRRRRGVPGVPPVQPAPVLHLHGGQRQPLPRTGALGGLDPRGGRGRARDRFLRPIVALGVPVVDTGMAFLRRLARGAPITGATGNTSTTGCSPSGSRRCAPRRRWWRRARSTRDSRWRSPGPPARGPVSSSAGSSSSTSSRCARSATSGPASSIGWPWSAGDTPPSAWRSARPRAGSTVRGASRSSRR